MTADDLARVTANVDRAEGRTTSGGYGDRYRACGTCRAEIGQPCRALNGRVAGGRPDGVLTPLTRPHAARKPRTAP